MSKVCVVGGREFKLRNYAYIKIKQYLLDNEIYDPSFICGKARGADTVGEEFAYDHGHDFLEFPPDYSRYGRRAPLVRNTEMANITDHVIAFWDGESRGTKHMINASRKLGKKVVVYGYSTYYIEVMPNDINWTFIAPKDYREEDKRRRQVQIPDEFPNPSDYVEKMLLLEREGGPFQSSD